MAPNYWRLIVVIWAFVQMSSPYTLDCQVMLPLLYRSTIIWQWPADNHYKCVIIPFAELFYLRQIFMVLIINTGEILLMDLQSWESYNVHPAIECLVILPHKGRC